MKAPRSLQGRLLVWMLGVLTVVWIAAALATWIDAQHELDELLDSHLAQAGALLLAQQTHELAEGDEHLDVLPLHRYSPRVVFQVWHGGRLALRSLNAPEIRMSHLDHGFETLKIGETSWRVLAARGDPSNVQVYVGEQTESRAAIMVAVMRSMLWPLLIALPLSGLVSWWGVRHGLAPLRRLGLAVAEREPQAVQAIHMDEAPAEMLPLISALNRLFERIADLLESERRFTADATHELRTPIAAIRAQAQVAMAAKQSGQRLHALQSTLLACDRATHLVQQLLTLSRLEAGAAVASETLELGELVRHVLAELAPHAIERQQMIELDAPDPCSVLGDPALLGVLVRNLVDNAIRYSPASSPLSIGVHALHAQVVLSVDDGGPGLDDAHRQRLGERFFRVLGTGQNGSGLGWSIVRRIATAHGAGIEVGPSSHLGGLSVQVSFVRSLAR